jgi:hypothetical protein
MKILAILLSVSIFASTAWSEAPQSEVAYSFPDMTGQPNAPLIEGTDGLFYGTTTGGQIVSACLG